MAVTTDIETATKVREYIEERGTVLAAERVLVVPDTQPDHVGNIIVPDQAQDATYSGVVVAIGSALDESLLNRRVYFRPFTETYTFLGGELEVATLHYKDILLAENQ